MLSIFHTWYKLKIKNETDETLKNKLYEKLQILKVKLSERLKAPNCESKHVEIYENFECPYIFASLGSNATGASLNEITQRCNLSQERCDYLLKRMLETDLIRYDKEIDRYFPNHFHVIYKEIGSNQFYKNFFLYTAKKAIQKANSNFESNEDLFFSSVVSVDKSQLAHIKNQIRELLLNYIERIESTESEAIATINLSFWT